MRLLYELLLVRRGRLCRTCLRVKRCFMLSGLYRLLRAGGVVSAGASFNRSFLYEGPLSCSELSFCTVVLAGSVFVTGCSVSFTVLTFGMTTGGFAGASSASCDVCSGSFEALTTGVSTGSAAGGAVSSASCGFSAAFSALPTGAGSAGGCSCCAGGVSAGLSSIISTTSTTSSSGSSLFLPFLRGFA